MPTWRAFVTGPVVATATRRRRARRPGGESNPAAPFCRRSYSPEHLVDSMRHGVTCGNRTRPRRVTASPLRQSSNVTMWFGKDSNLHLPGFDRALDPRAAEPYAPPHTNKSEQRDSNPHPRVWKTRTLPLDHARDPHPLARIQGGAAHGSRTRPLLRTKKASSHDDPSGARLRRVESNHHRTA